MSQFNNILEIQSPDSSLTSLIYNSLYGNISFLEKKNVDFLLSYQNYATYQINKLNKLNKSIFDSFRKRRYIIDDEDYEKHSINRLKTETERVKKQKVIVGFVMKREELANVSETSERLKAAFQGIESLLSKQTKNISFGLFIPGYIEKEHFDSLTIFFDLLSRFSQLHEKCMLSYTINTNGIIAEKPTSFLKAMAYTSKRPKGRLATVIDDSYKTIFDNLSDWYLNLSNLITAMANKGIVSTVHFNIRNKNFDTIMDIMIKKLLEGEIYGYGLNKIFLIPQERDYYYGNICKYTYIDWNMVKRVMRKISNGREYRTVWLDGPPIIWKFQRLLSERRKLYPSIYFCPFIQNGFVFNAKGSIHCCLLASAENTESPLKIGSYYPHFSIHNELLRQCRNRNVLNMEKCRNCPNALLCGGGCAKESLEKNGDISYGICQPVGDMIKSGIETFISDFL